MADSRTMSITYHHFLFIKIWCGDNRMGRFFKIILGKKSNGNDYEVIINLRFPRILATGIVGSAFAMAGAAMQGLTKNHLADSGILGINAGASFMLAICFALGSRSNFLLMMMYSFVGA